MIVPLSAVGFMSVQNYAKAVKVAKESNKNEAFARIPLQIKSLERFKSCAKTPTGMEQCSNEVAQLE